MTIVMENVEWAVKKTDHYIRYSIPNKDCFSNIEYKVLLSQKENHLLRCSKITCNGCPQLVYNVQQMQVVSAVISGLSTSKYYLFLSEVLNIYHYVKNNGFLNENHLQLDLDLMFITLEPLQVSMIYLPVISDMDVSDELIGGRICNFLISTTKLILAFDDSGGIELIEHLKSNTVTLEEITTRLETGYYEKISAAGRKREIERVKKLKNNTFSSKKIQLVQKNTHNALTIPITKTEFVIGKKASAVDGVIEGYPTVSRIHCKIITYKDMYMIVDLGSVNGTMVNEVSCAPNIPVRIKNGDQITISNLVFNFIEEK